MRQIQRGSCTAGSLAFFLLRTFFRGSKRAIWGIGFRVFSAFDNGVLSVRPAKTEIRHSLLVPLNAPAHKVLSDTPTVKLAGYTVRQESVLRSNSHLGVSVLLAGAYKGNTKPANEISVLCPGEQHRAQLSNLEKTRIIAGCPKGTR